MSRENAIIAEMQKEVWVMEPRHLNALFTRVIELEIKAPENVEVVKPVKMMVEGDTAIIRVSGVLLKNIPSLYRWLGIEMTSYIDIQNQLKEAMADSSIKKILLDVDSPGGVVAGVMETGQAIARAAEVKKVTARIDDLGASGAYWLASQASKITAGPNAEVGSIGVFTVYVDSEQRAKELGFKVHIVRSGEHKGMGVPGAEITENQLAAVQKIIDGMADNFIQAVSSGRAMKPEAVRELADGRVYLAPDAKKAGLIDSIITANKTSKVKETKIMTEEQEKEKTASEKTASDKTGAGTAGKETVKDTQPEKKAATIAELQAEFPEEPQFVLEQLKKEASLLEAKAAFAEVLKTRNSELDKQNKELQKKAGKKKPTGADPIPGGNEGDADGESFIQAARDHANEHKCTMTEAMKKVKKQKPELYDAYIEKCQSNRTKAGNED